MARDGSRLTVMQDVSEKTDYDEIGGTTSDLRVFPRPAGPGRLVAAGKDLKGLVAMAKAAPDRIPAGHYSDISAMLMTGWDPRQIGRAHV